MLNVEQLVGLSEAAALLPKTAGKRVSNVSLWRWITYGRDGVYLEASRIGGRFYTTRESLLRFGAALTVKAREAAAARPLHVDKRKPKTTPAAHEKRIARANAVLDGAGII